MKNKLLNPLLASVCALASCAIALIVFKAHCNMNSVLSEQFEFLLWIVGHWNSVCPAHPAHPAHSAQQQGGQQETTQMHHIIFSRSTFFILSSFRLWTIYYLLSVISNSIILLSLFILAFSPRKLAPHLQLPLQIHIINQPRFGNTGRYKTGFSENCNEGTCQRHQGGQEENIEIGRVLRGENACTSRRKRNRSGTQVPRNNSGYSATGRLVEDS